MHPGSEAEDKTALHVGLRCYQHVTMLPTSGLENPFTCTLLENSLSQKRFISEMDAGTARISCLTAGACDGSLFPLYRSLSAPWSPCWDGQSMESFAAALRHTSSRWNSTWAGEGDPLLNALHGRVEVIGRIMSSSSSKKLAISLSM